MSMDTIYYMLEIVIYAAMILFAGFYIAYMIDNHHDDMKRIIIARRSILKDLTIIAESVDENNRLLAKIIKNKKRRYEDARK
jgi:short subunit fatty acids transporter